MDKSAEMKLEEGIKSKYKWKQYTAELVRYYQVTKGRKITRLEAFYYALQEVVKQQERLTAKNVELKLLFEEQNADIDKINELNKHWFDAMKQVVEICSHNHDGLEKQVLTEIKGLVKDL